MDNGELKNGQNIPEHEREERTAETYFHDLGLSWETLQGKRILDIGAGQANFAQAAKRRGIDVVSLDIEPGGYGNNGQVPSDIPYMVTDFKAGVDLPDQSFDMVVARASVHSMVETEEDLRQVLAEARRLLRPDGEFRFTSVGMLSPVRQDEWGRWLELLEKVRENETLSSEEDAWGAQVYPAYEKYLKREEELRTLPTLERTERIKEYILSDLQQIDPSITVHQYTRTYNWKGEIVQEPAEYYAIKKQLPGRE